jgi:hypothetical protein
MKPLTTSVYTFCKLIEGGFLYVDKSAGIYELVQPPFAQYFLSRPRRFGKSLLISTLKSIFLGHRELFDGLAIDKMDYDWQKYPVIHLDLGTAAAQTAAELEDKLLYAVERQASINGVELISKSSNTRFMELVETLSSRDGKVVILVDEYDKPLLGHLGSESAVEIQRVLKQFYSVIKTTEAQQRFVLLTGVSKFSKVSVFSDLNNLTDLTMQRSTATLLGYTQDEVENNFGEYIDALADELGKSRDDMLEELRVWYNGYRFHPAAETVYNPVSLMKCFANLEFKNYWFETGTPSFLVKLLKNMPIDMENLTADESDFSTYEPENLAVLPLLVQTGYLTIKRADEFNDVRLFTLGYPNREIEQSFNRWLAVEFANIQPHEFSGTLLGLIRTLNAGQVDEMLEHMKTFFAQVPNTITLKNEKYYQTIFFTVFKVLGAAIDVEVSTNIGRIDAVVKTNQNIYIFEFKLHGSAGDALRQIREKGYAEGYRDDGRPVRLIGVAFGEGERNITDWLIENL